jgi:beta-lactam-binding protein with PASTA domain
MWGYLQVALLLTVLATLAMLAAIITMHFSIHGAEVQVPALKGMTVADARSQTAGLGLNLDVDNRYYSSSVGAGHILTQSPASGTVVRREWTVRVSESLGPQTINVPNTVGKDERMAEMELRTAGLGVGTIARLPIAGIVEGTVLAQDPPGKSQGLERPSVNLLVAAASDETADGYVMPDLTGLPVRSAQAELASVGIKDVTAKILTVPIGTVGKGDVLPKAPVRPGSVLTQQPQAGSRVDLSTRVSLTVAK